MDVGEDRATVEDHLDHPIALHTSNPSAKHSDMFYARSPVSFIYSVVASLPAVFLGLLLNVLDAMSYGIIVFPASDTHIPQDSTYAGISMFLASTIIAQLGRS